MKKISFYITILFRKTINEKIDATQLAQEVYNLIESKDPLRTLEIIKAFENICEHKMHEEKKRCEEICRAVNNKYVSQPVKPRYYDPNFDKSLNELNVTFEA